MNRSVLTLPEAMLRTLRVILSAGNMRYIFINAGIVMLTFIAIAHGPFRGMGFDTMRIIMYLALLAAGLIFLNKTADNIAGIYNNGTDDISSSLRNELSSREAGQFCAGYIALGAFISVFDNFATDGLGNTGDYISIALNVFFLFLTPAITLRFLTQGSATSMLNVPAGLSAALVEMGPVRYLATAGIILVVSYGVPYFIYLLLRYGFGNLIFRLLSYAFSGSFSLGLLMTYILAIIVMILLQIIQSFSLTFPVYLYPSSAVNEDKNDTFTDHDADAAQPQPTPFQPRPATSTNNARNGNPDYDLSPAASRQQQTPPAQPAAAPSLHKTPPTQPAAAEPDFRLLADADTRDMGIETQKAFALALARADALIRRGDNLSAIALLKTYANEQRDVAAYFPAYARLYRLDPQPALLHRLIHSAATGHRPSYDLIHDTLEHSDPASLPADSILPLAQQAGKQQHYRTVLNLTRNFAKNHPNHPHLVENYYLAALALAKTGAVDKALPLLQQLHTRYPDHPRAAIIAQAIARLQGSRQT